MKKQKEQFVKVCPKCGSTDLAPIDIMPRPRKKLFLFLKKFIITVPSYLNAIHPTLCRCRNCNYRGNAIEIEEKSISKYTNKKRLLAP